MTGGTVVVLNGAPRSGKTTIARMLIDQLPGPWVNLGVDAMQAATPERLRPGMGLRPGGERPDLEPFLVAAYEATYDAVAVLSRAGVGVVVDAGHHDEYSRPLGILQRSAAQLADAPVLFVGVRCATREAMTRRAATWADEPDLQRVERWEQAVHRPGIYDLEVDTSVVTPAECVRLIAERLARGPGTAFGRAAASGR